VVLDPPAFAKTKSHLRNALKAYQQANTAALSLLRPGGLLATSSCSYHIDAGEFLALLQQSARALGGGIRLIEYRAQGRDHPALLAMPETRYLKCALLQKI
jgi:23S rRNA (cytosine1962-C5)-methyltransferase